MENIVYRENIVKAIFSVLIYWVFGVFNRV